MNCGRLRAVKASGYDPDVIMSVYKDFAESAYGAVRNDKRRLADWFLETFPEVGK